jgi:kynureninase
MERVYYTHCRRCDRQCYSWTRVIFSSRNRQDMPNNANKENNRWTGCSVGKKGKSHASISWRVQCSTWYENTVKMWFKNEFQASWISLTDENSNLVGFDMDNNHRKVCLHHLTYSIIRKLVIFYLLTFYLLLHATVTNSDYFTRLYFIWNGRL